jgi:hypothetical protein
VTTQATRASMRIEATLAPVGRDQMLKGCGYGAAHPAPSVRRRIVTFDWNLG